MSIRVLRCAHCGLSHDESTVTCPATGLPLRLVAQRPGGPAPAAIPPAVAPVVGRPKRKRRDLIGRVVGEKYRISALIGEGGMGAVYEAEHLDLGRMVAVKVIHPDHSGKREAVSRLQHEARVVGTVGHPNICGIYDLGRLDDGSPYLVMERLQGESLATRIAEQGPVPPRELLDIVLQVLSALTTAHAKSVIHRDLKPDNIFLVKRGGTPPVAKLLDFGISKASDIEDTALNLTRTGMVMGTPYYMAPEQAQGERELDHRVDIWAVGVILYEGLSARRPFVARNYNALLVQILTTQHRGLREVNPAVPISLANIVDWTLAKSRDDRPQSASELEQALNTVLTELETPAARPRGRRRGTVRMPMAGPSEAPGQVGRRARGLGAVSEPPRPDPKRHRAKPSGDVERKRARPSKRRRLSSIPPLSELPTVVKRRAEPVREVEFNDTQTDDPTVVMSGRELPEREEPTPVVGFGEDFEGEKTEVDPPSFSSEPRTVVRLPKGRG